MSIPFVDTVRRNHALEHATISLLRRHLAPETHVSGRSTVSGFYLYGDIPDGLVEQSAREALALLQQGQRHLAVSDQGGTKLAVSGIVTGLAALMAVGRGRRLDRLPQALLMAVMASLLSRPLGAWVQRRLTTEAEVGDLAISSVERRRRGPLVVHTVRTRGG